MSERKTWADVLDVLPLEKRPRNCDDAHSRIAAEDYVREWCGKRKSRFAISDYHDTVVGIEEVTGRVGTMTGFHCIGIGPDLPTALYHAVAYCKEHQQ